MHFFRNVQGSDTTSDTIYTKVCNKKKLTYIVSHFVYRDILLLFYNAFRFHS